MTEQERKELRSKIRREKKQARGSLTPEERAEKSARAVDDILIFDRKSDAL